MYVNGIYSKVQNHLKYNSLNVPETYQTCTNAHFKYIARIFLEHKNVPVSLFYRFVVIIVLYTVIVHVHVWTYKNHTNRVRSMYIV